MSDAAVVVVGSVNADLVVSVRQLPRPGETVSGGSFARHGGGKGANQAVAAARAGARVALVAAVGADDLGEEALAALVAEGIDVSAVQRRDDVPTGVAAIVVDARGENQIAVASGANATLSGEAIEAVLPELLTGTPGVVLLGHEIPPDAVAAGAHTARSAGWRVILNPAPARSLLDDVTGIVLTPNADEARALSGEEDIEAAGRALALRSGAPVLVTVASHGALLLDRDAAEHLPAPDVEVIDTTGAGDTVNGALAARLAIGEPLRAAVRFALAAASLSTRAPGARAGMPRREDVLAAL
jgi:ribokinase